MDQHVLPICAGMTAFDPGGTWRKVVNARLPTTGTR
jgi:hypothetical protein